MGNLLKQARRCARALRALPAEWRKVAQL